MNPAQAIDHQERLLALMTEQAHAMEVIAEKMAEHVFSPEEKQNLLNYYKARSELADQRYAEATQFYDQFTNFRRWSTWASWALMWLSGFLTRGLYDLWTSATP